MSEKKKRFDLWPLIVGVIAAIGIIFSPSTGGGITRQPTDPTAEQTTAAAGANSPAATSVATIATDADAAPNATSATSTTSASGAAIDGMTLRLLSLTERVKRGETAAITVSGQPGTAYSIEIRLGRHVSTASGLEPKTSDTSGVVSWSWRVGPISEYGEYRIVITGGGQSLDLPFFVE